MCRVWTAATESGFSGASRGLDPPAASTPLKPEVLEDLRQRHVWSPSCLCQEKTKRLREAPSVVGGFVWFCASGCGLRENPSSLHHDKCDFVTRASKHDVGTEVNKKIKKKKCRRGRCHGNPSRCISLPPSIPSSLLLFLLSSL